MAGRRYRLSPLSIRETGTTYSAPIAGATVTVYEAGSGTTSLATCYADTTTGTALVGSATTTSASGYFEFFVDSKDYTSTQRFKIVITKATYSDVTYDNLIILPDLSGVTDPYVDVRAYGAVGDGVTDDTAAIQAAIVSGKTIYLQKGKTFKYTSLSITTETNVTFTGGGTLLDGYIQVSPTSVTAVHITFDDVCFSFTTLATGNNPLRFKNTGRVNIRNCEFTNCDKSIYIMPQDTEQHCYRFNITENRFMTCNYNIYAERIGSPSYKWYIGDFQFINNICEATQITNIYGEGVDGITIANNIFFHAGVSTNKKNIYLETATWVNIAENKCFEAGEEGIYIQYFTKVMIENNHIAWPGQLVQSSGIVLVDGGIPSGETIPNSIVMGNVIEAPTKHGIDVVNSNMVSTIGNSMNYVGASTHWRGGSFPSITHYGIIYDATSSEGLVFLNNSNNVENSISTSTNTFRGLNGYYNTSTGGRSFDYNSVVLTVAGSETTLNLNNKERVHLNNSTGHTISVINGGVVGQEVTFFGITGNSTIANSASIKLNGAVNATVPVDRTLTIKYSNSGWWEISRSF